MGHSNSLKNLTADIQAKRGHLLDDIDPEQLFGEPIYGK